MKTLDFKTACILAGYNYQIIDEEGDIISILYPMGDSFVTTETLCCEGVVKYSEIGTKYWILARILGRSLYKYTPINQIDAWLKDHFAIGLEPEWWKPIKD